MSLDHSPDRNGFAPQGPVAEFLGLSSRTMERLRLEGRGPVFCKFGRRVMYRWRDVLEWGCPAAHEHQRQRRGRVMVRVDFAAINRVALARLPVLLSRWLPDGRREGREYVTRNPTRIDRRAGSFRVNVVTGRWADFATGDKGGDVVSLGAYLSGIGQADAARRLAAMLGMESGR